MTIGKAAGTRRESAGQNGRRPSLTTVETLRLLGAGASGAILMALGDGPLRTKELTRRVHGYTPRTVYRYAAKLADLGVIEREEEPGVPSKVVHSLSEPFGRELYDLVEAYADASLTRLPGGEIDARAWGSLRLLADLWESGMVDELSVAPRSVTELARGTQSLSYHQMSRRASLLEIGGFVEELFPERRRRCYALTDKARRGMALIAGIGRWRRRHIVPEGTTGLSASETSRVLRTALPLVVLPEHGGKSFGLHVMSAKGERKGDGEALWMQVEGRGSVLNCACPPEKLDGRAKGAVRAWIDALLDGFHREVQTEGDHHLIETCMSRLHTVLWSSDLAEQDAPAPASSGR